MNRLSKKVLTPASAIFNIEHTFDKKNEHKMIIEIYDHDQMNLDMFNHKNDKKNCIMLIMKS